MSTYEGTNYFVSLEAAYRYYAQQGSDKGSVNEYIKEGLISIGFPPNIKGEFLFIKEGRYHIKEEIKNVRKNKNSPKK